MVVVIAASIGLVRKVAGELAVRQKGRPMSPTYYVQPAPVFGAISATARLGWSSAGRPPTSGAFCPCAGPGAGRLGN